MGSRRRSVALAMDDRLIEAFWGLARDNRVDRITVKMVVAEAGCSRGSFYYYFEDVPSLAFTAVEREILLSEALPRVMRALVLNENNMIFEGRPGNLHAERIKLAATQGAHDLVVRALESSLEAVWREALKPGAERLDPETEFAVKMFSNGLQEAFPLKGDTLAADPGDRPERARKFLRAVSERARKAEGVSERDFAARLESLSSTAICLRG